MALSKTNRGTGGNATNSTSLAVVPASNFTAGTVAVLVVAYDNSVSGGADPFSSISDNAGNTWTTKINRLNDPGSANQGTVLRIFECLMLNTTLTTSHTITISFGSTTTQSKAWALMEIAAASGYRPVYQTGGSTTGSGNPTITSSSLNSGDLIIGANANEYGTAQTPTDDSDTTNGSWSASQYAEYGSTGAGQNILSQVKVVTGSGTQTFNPTYGSSSDNAIGWVSYREVAATALTPDATAVTVVAADPTVAKTYALAPDAGTFTVTAASVAISQTTALTPDATVILLSPVSVAVSVNQSLAPDPTAVTVVATDPAVAKTYALAPDPGTVALTPVEVTIAKTLGLTPGSGVATVTAPSVSVSLTLGLAPDPTAVDLTGVAPTVSKTYPLAPDASPITVVAPSVSVGLGTLNLTPDPTLVSLTPVDVTVTLVKALAPDPTGITVVAASVTIYQPGGLQNINPDAVTVTIVPVEVTVGHALEITPDPTAITLEAEDPTVSLSLGLTPDPAAFTLALPDPEVVQSGFNIQPDPVQIALLAADVTVAQQVRIEGYTRDANRQPLPFCTVDLFRVSDNEFIGTTSSDGLGHYSILAGMDPATEYFLVAYIGDYVGVSSRDVVGAA